MACSSHANRKFANDTSSHFFKASLILNTDMYRSSDSLLKSNFMNLGCVSSSSSNDVKCKAPSLRATVPSNSSGPSMVKRPEPLAGPPYQ